jgi:valyl-tRNA synthetase
MKFGKSYEPGEFEPDVYALWEGSGAFEPSTGTTKDNYSIVMPPPNANGNLHIGHGLTTALQDCLIRYHRLRGDATWYIPGADHAGFETWVVYEKALEASGYSRFDYNRDELYAQVWQFVEEQRGNMELQLRALGASCDWDALTFTLDKKVIDRVYETFHKMWDEGLVYRGEKLVNYCTTHQTAFADIEVVYKEEKVPLYYIKYGPFTLATTRPETKFGDTGVAVNPKDDRYKKYVGKTVTVEGVNGPFKVKVVADEMVDMEFGTGVVKITPAHDFNDWETGQKHGLEAVQVIDEEGRMTEFAGRFAGMEVLEAKKAVVEAMQDKGLIVKIDEDYVNKTPHCYKCGSVIEPMLKKQWFVDVKELARGAVKRLEKGEIKFYPVSKKKVLINYLKNLKDWNISRQIPWGIPIPAYRSEEDGEKWIFRADVDETEIEVDGVKYVRDEDTFDTWFSSAHWPMVCTEGREGFYPLSVMETGVDILFAWVARMIMVGVYVTDEVPFKDVYLHGLVLDEHGQKMSKSKGNVINPMEMIAKYGSDAFRLGIIKNRSAGMNQAFSEAAVIAGRNLCNKLWNISRLIQGVVDESDSSSEGSSLPYTTDNAGEDWICRELSECNRQLHKLMAEYRFAEAEELLYSTIWDKYADWFIESQKLSKNVPLLKVTLENILVMLHPFAPFATETIWQNLSWTEGMLITQKWPQELKYDAVSARTFVDVQELIREARRVLQVLPGSETWPLLYGDDQLVADNTMLIQFMTRVPEVVCTDELRGVRLALNGHELYLAVNEEIVTKYRDNLQAKILAVGREANTLNLRLSNPNYVAKAPKELVEETRKTLEEKEALIERLKGELEVVK